MCYVLLCLRIYLQDDFITDFSSCAGQYIYILYVNVHMYIQFASITHERGESASNCMQGRSRAQIETSFMLFHPRPRSSLPPLRRPLARVRLLFGRRHQMRNSRKNERNLGSVLAVLRACEWYWGVKRLSFGFSSISKCGPNGGVFNFGCFSIVFFGSESIFYCLFCACLAFPCLSLLLCFPVFFPVLFLASL